MAHEFLVIGLTIIIGFFSILIFERTRISQVIILMLFGFLLGPALGILDVSQQSVIISILPFISTLALIVLLFDGGLEFDIFSVASSIPKSMLFTFSVFIASVGVAGAFLFLVHGWALVHGILLGAVAGGTSSAIVIAMAEKTRASRETKSLLTVESTLTDAICIITTVVIVQILTAQQAPGAGAVIGLLLSSFSTAIILGAVTAVAWIGFLGRFTIDKYAYMLTLAAVFILYFVVEEIGGNGGFGVFVFGIFLGNARRIGKLANKDWENPMNGMMRFLQEEVAFFVRTFFFVYIGLLLSVNYFTPLVLGSSFALLVLFIAVRYAMQGIILPGIPTLDRNLTAWILPRGLAAAILATFPMANGIAIPNFQEFVFGILLLSNIAATAGVFAFDRR
jgi:cell volume regulation protein A